MDFHDPKLWTCKLHFQECNRSSWRRWEEHENTLSNSLPVVVLCFLNRHVSKLLNLVLHISKKRVSRRGKHSRKSRLLMATELCQNVKVCLQSTPNFVLFRLLEGLDHVLGYYIATHCWWATVSYAELRNKGHVWLAESNSKILVFYWLIQKAIRSAWNQEIGRVLFHWNLARCLYRDGETQRKSNMVVTIIWA